MKCEMLIIGIGVCVMVAMASCGNRNTSTSNVVSKDSVEAIASNDSAEQYMEFETLSDKDLWLRISPSDVESAKMKRLVDAYNASVVLNSILTDFDLQMRGYDRDSVLKAIKSIDVTKVTDAEVVSKLKAYKEEMLYLLSVKPEEVDQKKHNPWKAYDDLYAYLSKKYHVNTFGKLTEKEYRKKYDNCSGVPEWEQLRKKRGDGNLVGELTKKYESAQDFDARCIYAIELAHAYEDTRCSWNEYSNPAIPIMKSLMMEQKYSLYLNELWATWRVLYQDSMGSSKDSEIPNRLYNVYRNLCACTILSYLKENDQDIHATNVFLVLACKENILREGQYRYGNQAAVEKYYLFPEIYAKKE